MGEMEEEEEEGVLDLAWNTVVWRYATDCALSVQQVGM